MIRSQIIEASSFTQSRAEFNIPQKLASSIKIAHLGVYGGVGYVQNAITGMANVISKIVLRDGATVLSQYDQNVNNYLEFKLLQQNNSRHRNINKVLYASNFGMLSNNGGVNSGAPIAGILGASGEQAVNPRVCVDKHDLKRSAVAEADSDLAVVSLADMLGFCGATFSDGEEQLAGVIPCHIFSNLKLSIQFRAAADVAVNATTVAQPYLIFDELINPALEQQLAKPNVVAEYADLELEKVFLPQGIQTLKPYLNSFYGKTLGNLYMMLDDGASYALSQYQAGEVVRLNVNNTPLFQLTSGIDTPAKKAAFLRMLGIDLSVPLMSDRILNGVPTPANDADATSIYEGLAAGLSNVQSQFYSAGTCSYLAIPVNTRINQLQLDYARNAGAVDLSMLFWGEVMKVMTTGSDGNKVVSYM
jgi:hypothetical protein